MSDPAHAQANELATPSVGDRLWFARFRIRIFARRCAKKLGWTPEARVAESSSPASGMSSKPVPRTIWLYWDQGWSDVPALVDLSRASWEAHNPGWNVELLDAANISQYASIQVNRAEKDMTPMAWSDLVRLTLLAARGGVWADANTICQKPLDEWLVPHTQSGFFAFASPGPDRLIATWFLASEPENPLVVQWRNLAWRYWSIARKAGVYYWVHYLFPEALRLSEQADRIWRASAKFPATRPMAVKRHLQAGGDEADIYELLGSSEYPILKLNRRLAHSDHFMALLQGSIDAAGGSPPEREVAVGGTS